MHSPNFGVVQDDECFDPFNRSAAAPALRFTSSNPHTSTHSTSTTSRYLSQCPPPSPWSHKGKFYTIQVDVTNSVTSSQTQLAACVSLGWRNQKLLFEGKKVSAKGDTTLEDFGLNGGTEIQVLGSAVGGEKKRMEQILGNREARTRVCQVSSPAPESRSTDGQRILPQLI
jgi:hypothetical protein